MAPRSFRHEHAELEATSRRPRASSRLSRLPMLRSRRREIQMAGGRQTPAVGARADAFTRTFHGRADIAQTAPQTTTINLLYRLHKFSFSTDFRMLHRESM